MLIDLISHVRNLLKSLFHMLGNDMDRHSDNSDWDDARAEARMYWMQKAQDALDSAETLTQNAVEYLYKAQRRDMVGVPHTHRPQLEQKGFTPILDDVPLSADRGWERTRGFDALEQVILERANGTNSMFELHCKLEDYWQAQATVYEMDTVLEICDEVSRPIR